MKCPKCGTKCELDIEPFEATVYYCRKCQKIVKKLPIQRAQETPEAER